MKTALARCLLVLFGLLGALGMLEVGLRVAYPDGGLPAAHLQAFSHEMLASFQSDPVCGYLPIPGTGEYGPEGCVRNDYLCADRKGRTRVLFVGDSATRRGKLIAAVRECYGERGYEYWNAGVESFNTQQELVYYQRYNAVIHPDEVVLTFHNNDFQATPLVVREKGELKIYAAGADVNQWLFRHSYFYRWVWPRTELGDRRERAAQVYQSLAELKQLLAGQKIGFKVVLLPILRPMREWSEPELWSRRQSLEDFRRLGLTMVDLEPTLEQALREGINPRESGGDTWHPSAAVSASFARELFRRGLLQK